MRMKLSEARSRIRRSGAGYTLIELLVVIAILGLLTAIAVPQVVKYLDHAKLQSAKSSIQGISSALDLFKYDVGRYPTSEEGLQALVVSPPAAQSWNGPYVKKTSELTDPWGHPYQYRAPGQHGVFDLFSYGPDSSNMADLTHAITNWQ